MSGRAGRFRTGEDAKLAGARGRRVKGALHGHATVRSQGRVPGEEASEARRVNAMRRRLAKSLDAAPEYETGALLCPHGRGPMLTDSGEQER